MKGLFIKDLLVITKQLKLLLIVIPILAITGGNTMTCASILLGAMMPMIAIAYDEQSKWNELAVMMPYSKKALVLSKYMLGYLCMAGASVIYLFIQLLLTSISHEPISNTLFMLYFSIISGLFLIAVNTPIILKFGSQKGRIIFVVFMILAASLGSVINESIAQIPQIVIEVLPTILFMFVILLNIISFSISLKIKQS